MKGDFSKLDFDRKNKSKANFNGVLHQQGKVLLDSDWNEQTWINRHWQDTAGRDIIGAGVAAIPAEEPGGFKVTEASVSVDKVNITVRPGRAWVDGLLVHLDGENDIHRTATYFGPPVQSPGESESTITSGICDAVILEIWQEEINGFQIPEELEPALGGTDTIEWIHTDMAFRLFRLTEGDTCSNIGDKLNDDFSKKGKLKVSLQPTEVIPGDCPVVEGGGYTGFEHNLYRIEIAEINGDDVPMFKWSQFNGGLVGRGIFDAVENKAAITANLQAIITQDFKEFYLEALEYDPGSGHWKVTYGAEVTLNNENELELPVVPMFGTIPASPDGEEKHVFFRLWNGILVIADFPEAADPNELRDGIRLEFELPADASYIPGDYWTFSVRAGEIRNDQVLIDLEPPEGIQYHRVPLAILNWNSSRDISFENDEIEDCRDIIQPLTNKVICCSFTVGDGRSSRGDFNSIEEALRHLPGSGGEICILPGLHEASVIIKGKKSIKIRGCGERSKVIPAKSNREGPIFHVIDSQRIELENMDMINLGGTAVVLEGSKPGALKEIEIYNNRILACIEAISVKRGVELNIHHNRIRMLDKEKSGVAIFIVAEDSMIERNDIGVVPPESIPPPPGEEVPPEPTDPCAEPEKIYENKRYLTWYTQLVWTVSVVFPLKKPFRALGGIQIAGGSERVKVLENRISGGAGNGITLGGAIPSELPGQEEGEETEHIIKTERNIWGNVKEDETGLKGISLMFERSDGSVLPATTDNSATFLIDAEPGEYKVSIPGYEIESITVNDIEEFGRFHQISVVKEEIDPGDALAFLYEIQIDRNDISNMGLSGIGLPREAPPVVLSTASYRVLYAMAPPGFRNPVVSLSIYRNHIHQCLQNSFDEVMRTEAREKGLGGISLSMCGHLSIGENRIEVNGINHIQPVCGIYVAYGEQVDITHNHISGNGLATNITSPLEPGIRGGIVLKVSSLSNLELLTDQKSSISAGRYAARIHGNVVDQPAGQALRLMSLGPVSILDNRFNSELSGSEKIDSMVGGVLILNQGRTQVKRVEENVATTAAFARKQQASLRLPNGNILFNSNQTHVGPTNTSSFSQLIFSADDIGFDGNQSDNLVSGKLLINTLLYGMTLRASDNRFKEMGNEVSMSLFTLTRLLNNTTNNQGDHCIIAINLDPGRPKIDSGNQVLADAERCKILQGRLGEYVKNNPQSMGAIL